MVDSLRTYGGILLAAASNALAAGNHCCCNASGWFDIWLEVAGGEEENNQHVRYATILPINYADIYATHTFYNSWTARQFSTQAPENIVREGAIYHIDGTIWSAFEGRAGQPGTPSLLSNYRETGLQNSSQEFDVTWQGTALEVRGNFVEEFGAPIGYFCISTSYALTKPGGGLDNYHEVALDLYQGGVVTFLLSDLNTIILPGGGIGSETMPNGFGVFDNLATSIAFHLISAGGNHSDWIGLPTQHSITRSILSDSSIPGYFHGGSSTPSTDPDAPDTITCPATALRTIQYYGPVQLFFVGMPYFLAAQVLETESEAWAAVSFQGFPMSCGIKFNEVGGYTPLGPGTQFCLGDEFGEEVQSGWTINNPKTHGMFMELRVGKLKQDAHWTSIAENVTVPIRVDYTATYNDGHQNQYFEDPPDPTAYMILREAHPIFAQWHLFDARDTDGHWAGIARYDNIPTYDPVPSIIGDFGSPPAPLDPPRTSKLVLLIDGEKAVEWTFDGLRTPWETGAGEVGLGGQYLVFYTGADGGGDQLIGEPHVCAHGIVAVIRKVYEDGQEPSAANHAGGLFNPDKPYALCLYHGSSEIWRSPLLATKPVFGGYSDRWIYFATDYQDAQDAEMTDGQFQDRDLGFSVLPRQWIINYSGTEVIPWGVLTDDPTVMTFLTEGPVGQDIRPSSLNNAGYGYRVFQASDKYNLPATFAEMFAHRHDS